MGRAFEYRKAKKMARWGKMAVQFTRIGKEIAMAVKQAGPNPDSNSRLRLAIQNAKSVNMPKDNVERAIKKASSKDEKDFEELLYEGFGPHGIAFLIETATDNTNRTVANIRSHFNKCNGSLGNSGSVEFLFEHKAIFTINLPLQELEEVELELIDYGLEEIGQEEDEVYIQTSFVDFGKMQQALDERNIEILSTEKPRIPLTFKDDLSEEQIADIHKLIDRLEEDEDVQNVYHNMAE
ncbi:MAG: YebC/PmpR family DNA-binding transcriptional regulator [Chitinophagales bacterium]|jgi:YebC/PmpR family DNA-binding regulatory protein|nr:YebC/PmpR family DNA-binding transcriptional regulator [Chitinophagales bacterium]